MDTETDSGAPTEEELEQDLLRKLNEERAKAEKAPLPKGFLDQLQKESPDTYQDLMSLDLNNAEQTQAALENIDEWLQDFAYRRVETPIRGVFPDAQFDWDDKNRMRVVLQPYKTIQDLTLVKSPGGAWLLDGDGRCTYENSEAGLSNALRDAKQMVQVIDEDWDFWNNPETVAIEPEYRNNPYQAQLNVVALAKAGEFDQGLTYSSIEAAEGIARLLNSRFNERQSQLQVEAIQNKPVTLAQIEAGYSGAGVYLYDNKEGYFKGRWKNGAIHDGMLIYGGARFDFTPDDEGVVFGFNKEHQRVKVSIEPKTMKIHVEVRSQFTSEEDFLKTDVYLKAPDGSPLLDEDGNIVFKPRYEWLYLDDPEDYSVYKAGAAGEEELDEGTSEPSGDKGQAVASAAEAAPKAPKMDYRKDARENPEKYYTKTSGSTNDNGVLTFTPANRVAELAIHIEDLFDKETDKASLVLTKDGDAYEYKADGPKGPSWYDEDDNRLLIYKDDKVQYDRMKKEAPPLVTTTEPAEPAPREAVPQTVEAAAEDPEAAKKKARELAVTFNTLIQQAEGLSATLDFEKKTRETHPEDWKKVDTLYQVAQKVHDDPGFNLTLVPQETDADRHLVASVEARAAQLPQRFAMLGIPETDTESRLADAGADTSVTNG